MGLDHDFRPTTIIKGMFGRDPDALRNNSDNLFLDQRNVSFGELESFYQIVLLVV